MVIQLEDLHLLTRYGSPFMLRLYSYWYSPTFGLRPMWSYYLHFGDMKYITLPWLYLYWVWALFTVVVIILCVSSIYRGCHYTVYELYLLSNYLFKYLWSSPFILVSPFSIFQTHLCLMFFSFIWQAWITLIGEKLDATLTKVIWHS